MKILDRDVKRSARKACRWAGSLFWSVNFEISSSLQALLQGTLQLHLCGALRILRQMILIPKDGEKGEETKIPQKTVGFHPEPEER